MAETKKQKRERLERERRQKQDRTRRRSNEGDADLTDAVVDTVNDVSDYIGGGFD